jgi:phosphatidylglycerol:prolipoprotein diacylglycerol transferase
MEFFPTRQVALSIGPLAIHWYGLLYLVAFLLAWYLIPRLGKYRNLTLSKEQVSSLMSYAILGTLIGGRLGYVLFYGAEYFGEHPLEILAVWKGGMSSHGGFIGVMLALFLFARNEKIDLWKLGDIVVIPVALGLALGRLGNFINQELYGPATTLPWGIAIPGVEGLRHPTPLYAMLKDLFIAGICFLHLRVISYKLEAKSFGTTAALFLILYGILRFLIEYLRMETAPGLTMGPLHFTRGQILTIPIILLGLWIFWEKRREKHES